MDGQTLSGAVRLDDRAVSALMPMSARLDDTGEVAFVAPTLSRVLSGQAVAGRHIGSVFRLGGMAGDGAWPPLPGLPGRTLRLWPRQSPQTALRGHLVRLAEGGYLLNLGFGIGVLQAVRDHGLHDADFAPTDPTVDLLYLAEAKALVVSELKALTERLRDARALAEARARTDPLTGLANRRAFDEALGRAVSRAARGQAFALALIDLDRFKAVNDTLGHAAGDAVIRAVADILRRTIRRHDIAARLGGDEFAVILGQPNDPRGLADLARRIIDAIEVPIPHEGALCRISASIGLAISPAHSSPDPAHLLGAADAALYAAKEAGRGRAVLSGD
jgi:diguanylate cyclase (GGDEF)-like protein